MTRSVRLKSRGFTLVELAVVIAVIGVLASLVVLGMTKYKEESVDAQRAANAYTISEALEKYFDKHGEYPPCSEITKPASYVIQNVLPGITSDALKTPSGEGNLIKCEELEGPDGEDFFAYVGSDTSEECRGEEGTACFTFELKFIQARENKIQTIKSRRELALTESPNTGISADPVSPTEIYVEWVAVGDAIQYHLQRSTSPSFSNVTTTNHSGTSTTVGGLATETTYYFRVIASRVAGDIMSGVVSASTASLSAPTGTVSLAASMSGSDAVGTASGGSCEAGTLQYEIRYRTNGGSWSSWTTGSPRSVAATQGYKYEFQTRAKCVAGGSSSAYLDSASIPSVIRSVTAPTGLTISAGMSGTNARGTAGGGSCATGTTIERQIRYNGTSTSTAGGWSSWTTGTPRDVAANQGWKYTFEQQARCVGQFANSSWASSSSASVVRSIDAPSATQTSVNASTRTWSWSNPSCPTGTTAQSQYRFYTHTTAGSWVTTSSTSVTNASATSQGMIYGLQKQTRCTTVHTNGAWSSTSTNKTFTVPVVHRMVYAAGMKLVNSKNATIRIKTFSYGGRTEGAVCASGTAGEVALQTSVNDAAWTFTSSWTTATVNTQITASDFTQLAADDKLEVATSSRCRNTTTGVATDADGQAYKGGGLDRGNIYRRSGSTYNIVCPGTTKYSWCAGGYNSAGTQTTTSTAINECRIRQNGIETSTERWTARIAQDSNPPCWNPTPTSTDLNRLPTNYLM